MDKSEAIQKAIDEKIPTYCVWCRKESERNEVVDTGEAWERWVYCTHCDMESYHPIAEHE